MAVNGCRAASGERADAANGDGIVVEVIGRPELKGDGAAFAIHAKDDASLADAGAVVSLVVAAGVVDVGKDAGVIHADGYEARTTRFRRRGDDHDVSGVLVLQDVGRSPRDDVSGANAGDLMNRVPAGSVVRQRAEVVAILECAGPDMTLLFGDQRIVRRRNLLEDVSSAAWRISVHAGMTSASRPSKQLSQAIEVGRCRVSRCLRVYADRVSEEPLVFSGSGIERTISDFRSVVRGSRVALQRTRIFCM